MEIYKQHTQNQPENYNRDVPFISDEDQNIITDSNVIRETFADQYAFQNPDQPNLFENTSDNFFLEDINNAILDISPDSLIPLLAIMNSPT